MRQERGPSKKFNAEPLFDPELGELPDGARWREWLGRVEAAIFASPEPVPREALAKIVGRDCNLDDLLADIRDELRPRPYELVFWNHAVAKVRDTPDSGRLRRV